MSEWTKARTVVDEMVNRHFESAEYRRIFGVRLTPARQAVLDLHYPHYIKSRRDCWAVAAGKAPLDVKRAIWEHEKDELIFDERLGSAHLTDEEMAAAADEARLLPGARAAFWAWFHLCSTRSWIEALMVNHTTERKNNNEIVKGGGFTHRMAMKKAREIVGSVEKLDANTQLHMTADIGHSDMFDPVFEKYVRDADTGALIIRAARDCLALDRAYRGALGTAMVEVPETQAA